MTRKSIMTAIAVIMAVCVQGQNESKVRNYFPTTNDAQVVKQTTAAADSIQAEDEEDELMEQTDYISANFPYLSMCDWKPGMRFMVIPTQKDLIQNPFVDGRTGMMVSTRALKGKVFVFDGPTNNKGKLHEGMLFHVEGNPSETYIFEVPTLTFADYCGSKTGLPALAYLDEVDRAQDSLVGKEVQVLVRHFCRDLPTGNNSYEYVDIGDEEKGKRNSVMKITKVGVGNRNFPVKIIIEDPETKQEYFQLVTISHTNCGMRDEDFEPEEMKLHDFRGSFLLLDDKLAVGKNLKSWIGKQVYNFYDTKMRNSKGVTRKVPRLSVFTVNEMFRLGTSGKVTMKLKEQNTGELYTKEVEVERGKHTSDKELLATLFIEGDPMKIDGIKQKNMPFIRRGEVKKGFTEEEVRLTLGEPTSKMRVTTDYYQWLYQNDDPKMPFRTVDFNYKDHLVRKDMTK